jgi:hypothetical protein
LPDPADVDVAAGVDELLDVDALESLEEELELLAELDDEELELGAFAETFCSLRLSLR